MKMRKSNDFSRWAIIIITVVLGCLLLFSCQKEELPEFTTVKPKYPYEGYYKGTYTLKCDSLGINVTHPNNIIITSTNAEQITVENMGTSGIAYMSSDPAYYQYKKFYWIDVTDCGKKEVAISFTTGTGHISGDSLTEVGSLRILYMGKPYGGKWSTKTVKQH